jgi:hypothetical protein
MMAFALMMCWFVTPVKATTWYVDSSAATGAKNGGSWTNAWTALTQISGVAAGDTVYISGGPSGSTRTYSISGAWQPIGGTASASITYQIGQDSQHNGTAVFTGNQYFLWGNSATPLANIVISGDAGDGKRHFQIGALGQNSTIDGIGSSHLRLSYIDAPNAPGAFFGANGCSGIEIDHCHYHKATSSFDDVIVYMVTKSRPFDDSKIHDNIFESPHSTTSGQEGWGDDFMSGGNWSGVSVYNNQFISYPVANYKAGQHQDGMQPLGGDNIKVYGNYFENVTNYPVFGDAYYSGFNHFWVYNNIIVLTDALVQSFDSPQGIAIGSQGQGFIFNDIIIANNLVADYGHHQAIGLGNSPGSNTRITSCVMANNIALNVTLDLPINNNNDPNIAYANNISVSLSNGIGHFVNYVPLRSNNDFHLVAADRTFRGKGTNLSTYFITDKDGGTRPAGSAWDIGPYQFGAANTPQAPRNLRTVPGS